MKNLFKKLGRCSKVQLFAFGVLAIAFALYLFVDMGSSVAIMAAAPIVPLVKKDSGLSGEEEAFLRGIEGPINEAFEKFSKGFITNDGLNDVIKKALDDFKKENEGKVSPAALEKSLTEIQEVVKSMTKEIQKMKDNGISLGKGSSIEKAIDEIIDSPMFKEFLNGNTVKSGPIKFNTKGIVSFENSYDGNTMITQQTNRVVVDTNERKINIRDLMTIDKGDPEYTNVAYTKIYELDRNAASLSENGRLPESSFKVKEETAGISRVGTHLKISNRLLKSRAYLRSFLANRMIKWVRMSEDFQIMFGDGNGYNLNGIAKQSLDVSKWLVEDVEKGAAGDVLSVESYNGGKQIEVVFSKPFPKIEEGMLITFTGAPEVTTGTASNLNSSSLLHKQNDRRIILDIPYDGAVPKTAGKLNSDQIAALTFTVKNNFFNQVEDPNTVDAINAVIAVLTYAEFSPNLVVLNPSDVFMMQTQKDTSGRYLDIVTGTEGVKRVAGRSIVESTIVAPGHFLIGDAANGAYLIDYTNPTIEFAQDVEDKLTNQTTVIIQEELILVVYNPFAFAYGKLSDIVSAITKK